MNQIVNGANNLFVLAQLTLPDQIDNGLIKQVLSVARQHLKDGSRALDDLNVGVRAEDNLQDSVFEDPLLQVTHADRFRWIGLVLVVHETVPVVDCLTSSLSPPLKSPPLVRSLHHIPDVLQALQSLFEVLALEEPQGELEVRVF